MKIDKRGSWYKFVFSKEDLDTPGDPGSHIRYNERRLTNMEFSEHWGKWVLLGESEEFEELAEKLDPYVESHQISCIKYDRSPQEWFDLDQCVMCVYCDDRQKDEVLKILSQFGVKMKAWSYEREVIEKWLPGGLHLERWIKKAKLSEKDAETLRKESKQRYKKFFDNPDALCSGWAQ